MRATKEYRLSCTEEAKKIVDRLTLEQKVWLMSGNIQPEQWNRWSTFMLGFLSS